MQEEDFEINAEKMNAPSYKLLITTPMAAIMVSRKQSSQWPGLLEAIAPIYSSASEDTVGEVKEALLTVSFMLEAGDRLIPKYFASDDLSFDRMMEISATGADIWMVKLSDGEIEKSDAIKLFTAIQAGVIEAVGDVREENVMVDQLIQIQDKVIEHISSLN